MLKKFKKDSMLFRLRLGGYLVNYDMPNDIQSKIVSSISELEDKTEAIINQLEDDKLEAYQAIVDNCTFGNDWGNFCIHCGEQENICTEVLIHNKDCIVLKAEKYISEVKG